MVSSRESLDKAVVVSWRVGSGSPVCGACYSPSMNSTEYVYMMPLLELLILKLLVIKLIGPRETSACEDLAGALPKFPGLPRGG